MAATLPSHPSFLTPNSSLLIPSPPSASPSPTPQPPSPNINPTALYKLSYGLFVLTARDGQKDNGCIVNTVTQITNSPCRISVAVNKANFTRDMIVKSGKFNVSVLSESAPFSVFEQFGFKSGRDTDKFALAGSGLVTANSAVTKPDPARVNGIRYLTEHANAVLSATVIESLDYGTHTLFIADVTDAVVLSGEPSATYQYYFAHIKPKPKAPPEESKKGFVCKICGFTFEGDTLAADYICPLCKHGAEDFEPLRG
ncbi:MAG: flavin reductase [Firmicutes bacterium]|nr:flavin reductase [Bacillota bacterium]